MPLKRLTHAQLQRRQHPREFRPRAANRGYDHRHQKLRISELREHPQCTFCDRPATIIDHITPISRGGDVHDPENRRPVCRDCHDRLTENFRKTGRNEMPAALGD